MSKRTKLPVLCGLGIVFVLLLMALALSWEIRWAGYTDLTVEFVLTDAHTGAPIHGAELAVVNYGGLDGDGQRMRRDRIESERFALQTDDNGFASRVATRTMCSGYSSRLTPFRDTFAAAIPEWQVTVRAPGYRASEERHLGELRDARTVERTGPGQSRLVVPIQLEPLP